MDAFKFGWEAIPWINWIIGLIIILAAFGFMIFAALNVVKRRPVTIFVSVGSGIVLASYIFYVPLVLIASSIILGSGIIIIAFANLGDFRTFLSNPFKRTSAKAGNFGVEKIYDRSALYKTIETTVMNLSKTKTGAIITFEKSTSLKDMIVNGVPINAPVSMELLATIFYPGTRLHDGAVVIHGNEIIAASVFYTPTTKPFAGKYGSRHRAAIGISEVSDAVTVVVSEETGRISFAVNGQLDTVEPSSFLRALENYLDGVDKEEDE